MNLRPFVSEWGANTATAPVRPMDATCPICHEDLADDAATLRRKLQLSVAPPAKSGGKGLPFVGDCVC